MNFIDYEFPKTTISGEEFFTMQEDHQILRSRRTELGLTQQQVADKARIHLQQYQRLESGERHIYGASMRIGLSVCAVLKLDPYLFFPEIRQ